MQDSAGIVLREYRFAGSTRSITEAALALAFALFIASWHAGAWAQAWPAKTIRIIVPFTPGGPTDAVARVMAQHLTAALAQQVIVENRPGAGGTIGAAAAAKSPADGYTLFFATTSTFSIAPTLYANPGFDPARSFAPISQLVSAPFLVVVHPAVPARSLQELIKLAKARPGQLNFGSGGSGTPLHIAGEMFKTAAGVDLAHSSWLLARGS
jgi:tripartite-type tricarboxylate transporter receptor subunit TctC